MLHVDTGGELCSPCELLLWEGCKPAEKSEGLCGVCSRAPFTMVPLLPQACLCLSQGHTRLMYTSTCVSTLTSLCRCTRSSHCCEHHVPTCYLVFLSVSPAAGTSHLSTCSLMNRPYSQGPPGPSEVALVSARWPGHIEVPCGPWWPWLLSLSPWMVPPTSLS